LIEEFKIEVKNRRSFNSSSSINKTIEINEKKSQSSVHVKNYIDHKDECNEMSPEKIIGATEIDGKLMFLLQFENSKQIYLTPSKEANEKYPQIVIQFYEQKVTFFN